MHSKQQKQHNRDTQVADQFDEYILRALSDLNKATKASPVPERLTSYVPT